MRNVILFCLTAFSMPAQHLWVGVEPDLSEIGAESLLPPYTAGADYADEILLNTRARIQFSEIPPDTKWCLLARSTETTQGIAKILLRPDYLSLSQYQWNANSPSLIPLESRPVAIFSGIGTIENLIIDIIVSGAELMKDWQPRDISIEWTVELGGCLL